MCFVSAGGVWRARRVVFDEVAQAHERPRGDERRLAAVKVKPSPCLSAEPPLRGRRRSTLRRVRPRHAGCTAEVARFAAPGNYRARRRHCTLTAVPQHRASSRRRVSRNANGLACRLSTQRRPSSHFGFVIHRSFITYAHIPVASHAAGPWVPGRPEPTQLLDHPSLSPREGREELPSPCRAERARNGAPHRPPPQGPLAPRWTRASHCAQGAARPCGLDARV